MYNLRPPTSLAYRARSGKGAGKGTDPVAYLPQKSADKEGKAAKPLDRTTYSRSSSNAAPLPPRREGFDSDTCSRVPRIPRLKFNAEVRRNAEVLSTASRLPARRAEPGMLFLGVKGTDPFASPGPYAENDAKRRIRTLPPLRVEPLPRIYQILQIFCIENSIVILYIIFAHRVPWRAEREPKATPTTPRPPRPFAVPTAFC